MAGKPTVSPQLPNSALLEAFGTDLEFSRELAPLTSFKTGGAARYFMAARSEADLLRAVKAARRLSIPLFIMGGGSNLLVSDDGFDGLVIKLDVLGLEVVDGTNLQVGAGESLMDAVNFAAENSLAGLEFAAGIWGTVGGAIYGNAGAFGGEVGSLLRRATLVDASGDLREVGPDYLRFGYRHSLLKETREIVVRATLALSSGVQEEIEATIADILVKRDQRHPRELTAGCFFRNIPDETQEYGKLPAGKLLEEAGAKELSVGGARVFEKHANIIVNTGRATSKDIRRLADMMKQKVMNRFGIELQEEVQQLGSIL